MNTPAANPYYITHEDLTEYALSFLHNAKELVRRSISEPDVWERQNLRMQALNLQQKALALLEESNRQLRHLTERAVTFTDCQEMESDTTFQEKMRRT